MQSELGDFLDRIATLEQSAGCFMTKVVDGKQVVVETLPALGAK